MADSERQKEPVIPQDNTSAHINKDNISFANDHHGLFSGSNKRVFREDGKPEVTSIDLDESSGACETLTSRDVSNETRRKRPRRDFTYDEREKWPEFNSPCPVVDGKLDGTDVIHIDVNVTPRALSPADVTMTTKSKRPIGQAMQTNEDSSAKVSFPSPVVVTGNESRRRLERDATQLDQGDSDTLPAVESSSSDINKSAPSSQNCPKVDVVHTKDYDSPENDADSLRGEAYGHLLDKVRLNDIFVFFFFLRK